MRGKEALAASNRRYRAALDHIDRMTEQLADAKIRARAVEKQAARVGQVERYLTEHNNDELLAEALAAVEVWKARFRRYEARRKEAKAEVRERLAADAFHLMPIDTPTDMAEFLFTRYPKLVGLVLGGPLADFDERERYSIGLGRHALKLTPEHCRRLQVARGIRAGVENLPAANVGTYLSDALEALDAGFTKDEVRELLA
jgi:hypothetical protein